MSDMMYTFYENTILSITRGNHNGVPINAKPIYFITLIDLIGKGEIQNNKIFLSSELQKAFVATSKHFQPDLMPTPLFKPFYYSSSEIFYHLQVKKPLKTKGLSNMYIRENVEYAYLDNALWDLLQNANNRFRLRLAIVKHFFYDTKVQEVPMAAEPSNTYGEEEATPRQLWALRRATGIDYRGRGLTKAEAYEMISEAKKKAEEQGVDVTSNEPTTRQLNYLKRATGIDYSTKGITKAEATKMIRELKEVEKDDNSEADSLEATDRQIRYLKRATGIDYRGKGLTKREASKMIQECIEGEDGDSSTSKLQKTKLPEPEPGTLEYILSKCKTREEQLEAARKYFGEDK